MPEATFTRSSFLGGEWSKAAQGRIDKPEYLTALNTCINGILLETGAWTRRPGSMHAGTTRGGVAGRCISFPFKQSTPYTMEFTDGHLRFRNVAALVTTNDDQTVTSISAANPAKVLTAAAHTWSSLNQVFFNNLGTSCPPLQNRLFTATVTSSTEFTLTDAITGDTIDGATLGALGAGVTVSRVLDIETPFISDLWATVRSVQAETQSILLNGGVAPQVLVATLPAADDPFATFALDPAVFEDGPYLDPVGGGALITPSDVSGSITLTISFPAYVSTQVYNKGDFALSASINYRSLIDQNLNNTPAANPTKWEAVSAGVAVGPDGFTGADIGRMMRLYSEPPLWDTASNYAIGNMVAFGGAYWSALAAMTGAAASPGTINPNQPGIKTTTWAINASGAIWSWGKITGFGSQISQTLPGATNIGDMTSGGGLAAAFDSITSQTSLQGAREAANINPGISLTSFVGRNFTGATAQKIASATLYPSSDNGFAAGCSNTHVTLRLYASHSNPAAYDNGTLLGTTGLITDTTQAITIQSSDTTTSWEYVWAAVIYTNSDASAKGLNTDIAELQLFNPPGTGTSSTSVTFELLGEHLLYTTAIRVWRLGLFGGTLGYPSTGTYHEGRLWLAGTVDNRLDASVPNDLFNFAPTQSDGTVTDANAISYTLNAPDVNAIFWMEPDQQGIIVGTQAGEWLVQASNLNSPLTPTSMQAHRVTKIGCANIEPKRADHTLVFVQRYQHKVMEYFADVFSGKFSSPNLGLNAKHLMTRGIEELAYQQELTPVIWARCTDGSLIGASYKRENLASSQGPTFVGWHQHALGSARTVESICTGPSTDGLLDTLTMVTNDTDDIRHVEVLTNLFEEGSDITAAWLQDNAVHPSSLSTSGTTSMTFYGLWHLNGKTVAVVAGGLDLGDYAVASGAVTVPFLTGNALFTPTFGATLTVDDVLVGFTYTSDGQIVRPSSPQESGARNGPASAKIRRSEWFAMLLVDAQGISVGTDFDDVSPLLFETEGGTPFTELQLFSGVWRDNLDDDYTFDSMLCWRITRPKPATLANISGFLTTQDA